MIHCFEIKPSLQIIAAIMLMHLFALVLVFNFAVAFYLKWLLVCLIGLSWYWQGRRWAFCRYRLRFFAAGNQWSLSTDSLAWVNYRHISAIYLNDAFVWIVLTSPGLPPKYIWVGVDSMPAEQFLCFRRCILCPQLPQNTH